MGVRASEPRDRWDLVRRKNSPCLWTCGDRNANFLGMAELFTVENLLTLLMLTLLQAVLGFDNLLYISIESKRVEEGKQRHVRQVGIILAIALRIILLFVLLNAIDYFQDPFWSISTSVVHGEFTGHALIVLVGGGFLVYTAFKEIVHMLSPINLETEGDGKPKRSVAMAIVWIGVMNAIFSFDSILGAIALTDVFAVMATAIVISGVLMIALAESVSSFLQKNRMYEVLGLFILLIVGVMLLSEGGHLAHLKFFGFAIEPMTKTTFYFVIAVLVLIDIVQGRYQKNLLAKNESA